MELIHAKKNGTEIEMLVDPEADIELGGEGNMPTPCSFLFQRIRGIRASDTEI